MQRTVSEGVFGRALDLIHRTHHLFRDYRWLTAWADPEFWLLRKDAKAFLCEMGLLGDGVD